MSEVSYLGFETTPDAQMNYPLDIRCELSFTRLGCEKDMRQFPTLDNNAAQSQRFNERFAVPPANDGDLDRPIRVRPGDWRIFSAIKRKGILDHSSRSITTGSRSFLRRLKSPMDLPESMSMCSTSHRSKNRCSSLKRISTASSSKFRHIQDGSLASRKIGLYHFTAVLVHSHADCKRITPAKSEFRKLRFKLSRNLFPCLE
jgi:hypothetical protein